MYWQSCLFIIGALLSCAVCLRKVIKGRLAGKGEEAEGRVEQRI